MSPKNRQAHSLWQQGLHFYHQQQFDAALAAYGQVIALNPDFADVYVDRGLLYMDIQHHELALADLSRAVELNPDSFDACNHLGLVLLALKHFRPALECFEKALELNPSSGEVYNSIGVAFAGNGQLDIAREYYEKALKLNPELGAAFCNLANTFSRLNEYDAAMEYFDKALALDPEDAQANANKSLSLLVQARFDEGWPLYEYRFKANPKRLEKMNVPGRLWLGTQSIRDKTILLSHEAGFGDTIQFSRYAALVSALGAKVILHVQPALSDVMKTLKGVDGVIAHNEALTPETLDQYPPFDVYCPLMSLPLAFKTTFETIPGRTPYLSADPVKVAAWESRLGRKTKPRVGLVWSGNPQFHNDQKRSIMLPQFLPYLPDNCDYISLKKEVNDIDRIIFAAMTEWKHYEEELADFSDTAALCALMDVVVSVDTSVAHLSGALGKPTWLMLPFSPDWRWLLGRRDSPWYPGMRLYRQNEPGNWNDVFEDVRRDLLGLQLDGVS